MILVNNVDRKHYILPVFPQKVPIKVKSDFCITCYVLGIVKFLLQKKESRRIKESLKKN